jgi:methyl-accepting chemotaxis protein
MSTRKQLSLLLAALIGGTSLVAAASTLAVFLIRNQIVHLSRETSPTQVRLAKLQRGFERISTLFTRISAASTLAELSIMESDLGRTIGDVQSIAVELAATTNSGGTGVETGIIQTMTRTGDELRRTAWQRIEARKQIAEANRNVAAEIETVTTVTGKLSAAMAQLQMSSQAALVSSKQTSLDANTGIKALLVDGEKIEQLRSCLQEVRIIDKKFRLNPLRDKTGGILDSMAAQDLPGKMLTAQVKAFTIRFTAAFGGDAGLLAARAAVLAAPLDEKLRTVSEDRQKALLASVDELSRHIAAEIDPLELAVRNANAGMNRATELIALVASVSAASAEVNARGRSMQGLAWELLAASDKASVDRIAAEVARENSEVSRGLVSIRNGLSHIEHSADLGAAEAVRQAFAPVAGLLVGPSGVAPAMRAGLDKQLQADRLFAASIQSIRQVVSDGSNRAHDAEAAQEQAVAHIQRLSAITFLLVGLVACAAILVGSAVGRRVGRDILASEERQLQNAEEMRRIVERVSAGTRTLRLTSRGLTAASELVTRNVETIAAGAGHMQSSIRNIAASASEASDVGGGAVSLVAATSSAVAALHGASSEIGAVTEVIRTVALQTKLLALNAAIEAAHAGQLGAGFSVVAEEVKKLARAAAESTSEIDSRVTAMNDQVQHVTTAMAGISSIIGRIREMQETIAAAVKEQTATTVQITESIHETAAGCRGGASRQGIHAMALQLSGLAEELETLCELKSSAAPPSLT